MEKANTNVKGKLLVSEDVIASIAVNAVKDITDVVEVKPQQKSIKDFVFNKGENASVKVGYVDDVVEISLKIIIKSGAKAISVAEQVQESVKTAVQSMTGLPVARVNVLIADVSFNK